MKKMLMAALLGLGAALVSVSPIQAWSKCNFGMGVNWAWEGGGNNILWGMFKGENIPCMGGPPMGMGGDMDSGPMMAPPMGMPAPMPAPHQPAPGSMPRADAQPVGYLQYSQGSQAPSTPSPEYYAPSYWHNQ